MIEKMTKSEMQVMNLLWSCDKPLSCSEIVEFSENKTWKNSYVHTLIKSLIKKKIVRIAAFELISRSYARMFAPAMSYHEYCLLSSFTDEELRDTDTMSDFFDAFLKHAGTPALTQRIKDKLS